jgi:peptide/nickel transport system substrate-binding protein
MVGPPGLLYHVAMNALRPPFDRPAARAALKLMFDYSAIRFLVGGTGDVLQVPFVQGGTTSPGRPMPFRFDLAKAKRLWAQAGYPKGLRLHLLATEEGLLRDILELFQQDARRIGVDVRLTFAGESLVYSRWRARDYMLAAGTTGPYGHFDAVDANNPATNFMWNPDNKATEFRRYRSWRSGYSNPLARRLVEQASQSGDEEERRRIYQQLTRIYIAEAPFVLLYSDRQTILAGKDLFGLRYTRGWDLSMAGKR